MGQAVEGTLSPLSAFARLDCDPASETLRRL